MGGGPASEREGLLSCQTHFLGESPENREGLNSGEQKKSGNERGGILRISVKG